MKTYNYYPGHNNTERQYFFVARNTIVGIKLKINDIEGKFWNNKMEALLYCVHKGTLYNYGIEKYNNERSFVLRINNFVKYVLNDSE